MASKVGANGDLILDGEILERLGVKPGWEAVQILSGDHIEVHFLPPMRAGDSFGILHREGDPPLQSEGRSWSDVVRWAWSAEVTARESEDC